MTATQALEEMGEDDVLAFADACAETIRQAEADLLRAAYQWAVLHDPARLDPAESARPGREKARQLGGDGTAPVTEFAAAQLGARIGRSPYAAAQLIADALDLHHRLPQLWARVEAGEVRASYARHVCKMTRDLTHEEAAYVDAAVAEPADGRITWSRFEALVEAKVAQAAPELARAKEEQASKATFAKKLRTEAHGMATFMVRADIATIDQIDAAVTARADSSTSPCPMPPSTTAGSTPSCSWPTQAPTADTPTADLLPTVSSTCTPTRVPTRTEEPIARLEGHGPVTEAWITRVLGPTRSFKIQPVLDLAGQAPVDAYEIPDRHRQAVHLMTPADTFPFASSLSRRQAGGPHHPLRPGW